MLRFPYQLTFVRTGLIVALTLQMATPCQAGWFDWLFRRRQATTTVCCQPPVSCNACCGNRTVVNYAPQTVYTTNWVRVPVTTYRPVATTDPTTCCRVNYMQPATSYVWQARRQPHVVYRPFMSRIANACGCQSNLTSPGLAGGAGTFGPLVTTPATSAGAVVGAPAAPVGTGVPGATMDPYATSPYPNSPYALPGASPAAPSLNPNAGIGGAGVGSALDPADTRPRLDPNSIPQINNRISVPDTPLSTYPYTYGAPTLGAPTLGAPTLGGSSVLGAPHATTSAPNSHSAPIDPAPTNAPPSFPSMTAPRATTQKPAAEPTPAAPIGQRNGDGAQPNPVLDPDANSSMPTPTIRPQDVPRLLNPSDRTASLRPRLAAPVQWARVHPAVYRPNNARRGRHSRNVSTRPHVPQADIRQPLVMNDAEPRAVEPPSEPMVRVILGEPARVESRSNGTEMAPVILPRP